MMFFYNKCPDARALIMCSLFLLLFLSLTRMGLAATEVNPSFEIRKFSVEGNTIYTEETLDEVLLPFVGQNKTAADVEEARAILEKFFQENGFVRVLVNIPHQIVEEGEIRLEVTETEVARVKVTGNRYFTRSSILDKLPSLQTGQVLYAPDVEQQFRDLNRNPDLKIKLNLVPSREPGKDNIELKVEDAFPLHASLELNNRSSHDTTNLRLNGMIRYDNLWQKEHSISAQYQTSPKDTSEVQVIGGSYVLPAPWNRKNYIAFYALWTDSDTAFGEGFSTVGSGTIIGGRYLATLPPYKQYYHNLSLGLDYKDFNETTGYGGTAENVEAPITYLPFSMAYSATILDSQGVTRFNSGVSMAFRGAVTDQDEFAYKRYDARGNYLKLSLGLEREHKLPAGMSLKVELDGQIASEPLISSEQYSAGGMDSVRGYKESEALGDHAVHGTFQLNASELAKLMGWERFFECTPYVFYDFASLTIDEPLPGQDSSKTLQGTGLGIKGDVFDSVIYQLDVAMTLTESDRIDDGDSRIHFFVKYQF